MNANTNIALAVVVALIVGIVLGALAIQLFQRARTRRLKEHFGPEYGRAVAETGNRSRAEAMLEHRRRRVEQLQIRTLEPTERVRFQEGWRDVQARFVDNPGGAVTDADRLVRRSDVCGRISDAGVRAAGCGYFRRPPGRHRKLSRSAQYSTPKRARPCEHGRSTKSDDSLSKVI